MDGQAHAGSLLSKPGQDGLQDRHQRVVGGDQSPRVVCRGGIEGLGRRDGLAQGMQRIVQWDAQLFGTRRGLHALRSGQQKRIIQQLAQTGQLHADGGLCQVQDLGGAGDMPFSQQGVERDEQIQVDTAQDAVKWTWSGVRGVHGSGGGATWAAIRAFGQILVPRNGPFRESAACSDGLPEGWDLSLLRDGNRCRLEDGTCRRGGRGLHGTSRDSGMLSPSAMTGIVRIHFCYGPFLPIVALVAVGPLRPRGA